MRVLSHGVRAGRRFAPALGLASAMVLATQLAVVAPVAAALPGLTQVTSTGPSNSDWKTWQASCPTDSFLVAGGGRINGGGGQVVMDTMVPVFGGTDLYSVTGREDDSPGFTGDWSITATALCARPPDGWEHAESATGWDSNSSKTLTVSCPLGKRLLGVGVEVNGGLGQVVVDDLRPSADLSNVTITGIEDGTGYAAQWQLQGEVICVTAPAGLARVTGFGVFDSTPVKSAVASCPAGQRVHGVGGEIDSGAGQVRMTGIDLLSDTQVRVTAAEDEDGLASNWAPRAYAICA
ncbi:hypothetical protein GA0074692_4517 [Micromonospora pallida]|uniref:Uncharacterized protein n=1 Tax=Micromonospora pallida TaxID=145854 RepID=A0A1C6T647_9ACTN|nr:hypothetical protein [Micromonospora pallida]SCL36993.1 hypothetical protein GA0074692_4517 [Micromonospora pallida]